MAEAAAKDASSHVRIAIVGDVHNDWDTETDVRALRHLKPHLVLFVGDFGNEDVNVVKGVSEVPLPKAVILGNHDSWFTTKELHYGRRSTLRSTRDKVQEQLDLLGDSHVGYSRVDFPSLALSVVGGRPFSWGGPSWESAAGIVPARYGVESFEESAERIAEAALAAPSENALIFLGHNGPAGLGEKVHDICGRDWPDHRGKIVGGDHGDSDFRRAISKVRSNGRDVPAVVFGHMHHHLHRECKRQIPDSPSVRTMLAVEDNVQYVNAAVVPRVESARESHPRSTVVGSNGGVRSTLRHFTLMELDQHKKVVERVSDVWVKVAEDVEVVDSQVRVGEKAREEDGSDLRTPVFGF